MCLFPDSKSFISLILASRMPPLIHHNHNFKAYEQIWRSSHNYRLHLFLVYKSKFAVQLPPQSNLSLQKGRRQTN